MFNSAPPLFRLGKYPVTVAGLIILLEVVGMILVAITQTEVLRSAGFSPEALFKGQAWRLITYPFFAPLSLSFIIGLVFFFQFGKVVEADLGRTSFLYLVGALCFIPPLILSLCWMAGLGSYPLAGSQILHLSVFVAFCVMYPHLPSFFGIQMKWFGLAFAAISILEPLQSGAVPIALATMGAVFTALWLVQNRGLARIKIFPKGRSKVKRSKLKKSPLKVVKRKAGEQPIQSKLKPRARIPSDTEIDIILDKISKHGIHSLTEEERMTLQHKAKK